MDWINLRHSWRQFLSIPAKGAISVTKGLLGLSGGELSPFRDVLGRGFTPESVRQASSSKSAPGLPLVPSPSMYSSRVKGITRLHLMLQFAGVLVCYWTIYQLVNWTRFDGALEIGAYLQAFATLFVATIVEFLSRDPSTRHLSGLGKQARTGVSHRQTLFAIGSIFGVMVMLKEHNLSRVFLICFFSAYFLWISWSNRWGYRWLHRRLYQTKSQGRAATLLVGSPAEVNRFVSNQLALQPPGTDILGVVPVSTDGTLSLSLPGDLPLLGGFEDLRQICQETHARALLILGLQDRRDLVRPVTHLSEELGLRTVWIDDMTARFGNACDPFHTPTHSVVSPIREPLEDPLNRFLKRTVDLCGSLFGVLFVLPPAMLFVFCLHRLRSPGPLFYRQERSGRNGEAFPMWKFRSMNCVETAEEFDQAKEADPRIFRGGDFLRRSSLDELPQLINVLTGEMSLIGPRPHAIPLDEALAKRSSRYRLRQLAKPGMTGLAQSLGWRGETRHPKQLRNRIRLDLFYLEHWSLALDLQILVRTLWQVLRPPRSAC